MLTLYEFSQLKNWEKHDMAINRGEFICISGGSKNKYHLYFLYDFYVELHYVYGAFTKITPFKEGDLLDKHLRQIDISKLKPKK